MSGFDRSKTRQHEDKATETPTPQTSTSSPTTTTGPPAAPPPAAPADKPGYLDIFEAAQTDKSGDLPSNFNPFQVFDFNFGGLMGFEGSQADQIALSRNQSPWSAAPEFESRTLGTSNGGSTSWGGNLRTGGGTGGNLQSSTTTNSSVRELDAFSGWTAEQFAEIDGIGPVRSQQLADNMEGLSTASDLDGITQIGPGTIALLQGQVDDHMSNSVVQETTTRTGGAHYDNGNVRIGGANTVERTMGDGSTNSTNTGIGIGANKDGVAGGAVRQYGNTTTNDAGGTDSNANAFGLNANYNRDGSWMMGATYANQNGVTNADGTVESARLFEAGLGFGQTADGGLQGQGSAFVTTNDRGRTGLGFEHSTNKDGLTRTGLQASYDGNGGSASITTDKDGNVVGGGGGVIANNVGGQADILHTDTRDRVQVQAGNGVVTGNLSVDLIDGGSVGGVETAGQDSAASRMLGGNVMTAGTRDRQAFSAGAQYGVFSAEGGVSNENSVERLAVQPENMTPEQLTAWQEQSRAELPDSLSGVDFGQMANGSGYRFRSSNGWNAGGGAGYGVVGVSGSYASSSANEVTLVQQNGQLRVNLRSTEGSETKVGANVAGVIGLQGQFNGQDVQEYGFSVDPNNPQAMEAFQAFAETGVLPGARDIGSDAATEATASFDSATSDVTRLNEQIAALSPTALAEERMALLRQLDQANGRINDARDTLNTEWRSNNGASSSPVPGISVDRTSNQTQEGSGVNLTSAIGDLNLGSTTRTLTDIEEVNADGGVDHTYNGEVATSGAFVQEENFSISSTDANDPMAISMVSRGVLTRDAEAATLRNLDSSRRNVSDDRLTAMENSRWFDGMNLNQDVYEGMRGTTTVNLNTEDFTAIGDALNNGPEAAELWGNLASSSSNLFVQPEPVETGDGGSYTPPPGFVTEGISLPEGVSREQMQTTLASIEGPGDFQALDPAMQRVAVDAMVNSYRSGGSPYQALAAINLVEDPAVRAELTRSMFVDAQGENLGDQTDPVMAFIDFANEVSPEVGQVVQEATNFQLTNANVQAAMQLSQADRAKQFGGAFNTEMGGGLLQMRMQENNTGRQFDMLQASNAVGGSAEVLSMLQTAGADPMAVFDGFDGDGMRQREFLAMLGDSEVAQRLRADAGRMDAMNNDYQEDLEGNDFFDVDEREDGASSSIMNGLITSTFNDQTGDLETNMFGGAYREVTNYEDQYYERAIGGENGLLMQADLDDGIFGANVGGQNGLGIRRDADGNIDANIFGRNVDVDEAVDDAIEYVSETYDSVSETVGGWKDSVVSGAGSAVDSVSGWVSSWWD